jgi:hypothetical protein
VVGDRVTAATGMARDLRQYVGQRPDGPEGRQGIQQGPEQRFGTDILLRAVRWIADQPPTGVLQWNRYEGGLRPAWAGDPPQGRVSKTDRVNNPA